MAGAAWIAQAWAHFETRPSLMAFRDLPIYTLTGRASSEGVALHFASIGWMIGSLWTPAKHSGFPNFNCIDESTGLLS